MLYGSILVVELTCKVSRFLNSFGAFTREVGVTARNFGQSVDLLFEHRAQRVDVHAQLLQQVNANTVIFGDDGLQNVERLNSLLAVAGGK